MKQKAVIVVVHASTGEVLGMVPGQPLPKRLRPLTQPAKVAK